MRAYTETYLPRAQKNLGEAIDYAVNACDLNADDFMERFIASGFASEWEEGSPRVLSGLSGTELVRDVYATTGEDAKWPAPQRAFALSREYWAGWVLAYYHWWTSRSFRDIARIASVQSVIEMYNPLHEESENRFVDRMEELASEQKQIQSLKSLRQLRGWSQNDLAERSGVNIRSIRQYEQNPKSIERAEVRAIKALAQALTCRIDDLIPAQVSETE